MTRVESPHKLSVTHKLRSPPRGQLIAPSSPINKVNFLDSPQTACEERQEKEAQLRRIKVLEQRIQELHQ